MNVIPASQENEINILNTLQQLMNQVILAMKQGRSFILSGVVDGDDPSPMNFAATFGKPEDIFKIRDLFILNAGEISKKIDEVFEEVKKEKGAEVIKKEDGGIIINFNK